jgi:hypothetical protein
MYDYLHDLHSKSFGLDSPSYTINNRLETNFMKHVSKKINYLVQQIVQQIVHGINQQIVLKITGVDSPLR